MHNKRNLVSGVAVAAMLSVSSWLPAQAAMVSTEQLMSARAQDAREAQVSEVRQFLSRTDVREQLEAWGVRPELAEQRVAALSDTELQRLSQSIGSQPAGGDVLAVIGVVFLVLLILELVGVTNVFSRI